MNRIKAAAIHLTISLIIVAIVLSSMLLLWFPNNYFFLMGGTKLIAILFSVDISLGPILTFAIFKADKKGLKFDLYCIGIAQIFALLYGCSVMFESRPIFTVFDKNKFQVAAALDIAPEELKKAKNLLWKKPSIVGPVLVAIGIPNTTNKTEIMFSKVVGSNAYRYPRLYDAYNKHRADVIKAGRPLSELAKSKNKIELNQFIKKMRRSESEFLFLPISSELEDMSAIVDAKTGDFIEIINTAQK
jgi:hypothetical protein